MTKPTIALLGTGLMGAPMVRNLLAAGFPVQVWNRSLAKAEALAGDGATVCASPQVAVTGAQFIITMLSDGTATASVVTDPAVAEALQTGAIWIEMSSVKPAEARAQAQNLKELGVLHLDAPVSGGTRGAEAGSLAIMAGGEAEVFEASVPVLQAMGRPVHVGPSGAGQLAKLANQGIVAVTIGAVAEAMLLLEEGGADPAAVRRALKGGFADSVILQQHGERMTERNFVPGGLSKFQLKDLNNLLEEASSLDLDLPVSQHIRDRFAHFCEDMDGSDRDHSGLYLELRKRNKMKDIEQ
ncbi:2-hydroxy-3-oxopropionate reductase [Rhodobacterales bacterium 56_14_T64]|nr:2-hydroxy-3-oxopropionate reductase [Rhodobacterales bacterium 56_14_T64]